MKNAVYAILFAAALSVTLWGFFRIIKTEPVVVGPQPPCYGCHFDIPGAVTERSEIKPPPVKRRKPQSCRLPIRQGNHYFIMADQETGKEYRTKLSPLEYEILTSVIDRAFKEEP